MKKLLNEASLDEQFNTQISKIQDAILKLEKIALNYDKSGTAGLKPVRSQKTALEVASEDLVKIRNLMFNL